MSTVVLLTGGPPRDHDFAATAEATAEVVRDGGHLVHVTDDPDAAADALDGDADVLAVNALRWRMHDAPRYAEWYERWSYSPSPSTRRRIERFVADGGGLLATHTASICFDDWAGWGDLVGGSWQWGVSSHPPLGPVTIEVVAEHPAVEGLPTTFELHDEVYGDLDVRPGVEVLAVARRTPGDAQQPVVWAHRVGAGRVVYDGFGHDVASIASPEHRRLLAQSLEWVVGGHA